MARSTWCATSEHTFVADCMLPVAYDEACTETEDVGNDVWHYECPWDGQA